MDFVYGGGHRRGTAAGPVARLGGKPTADCSWIGGELGGRRDSWRIATNTQLIQELIRLGTHILMISSAARHRSEVRLKQSMGSEWWV